MTFHDLNLSTQLLNAIEEAGLTAPTTIQHKTYPAVMSGKDMIGIAQTGTGKTYAYILPILRMHKYSTKRAPTVLIIVPTRELVLQVVEEIEKMSTYINVRCIGIYGGANINTQKDRIYEGCDILVATPGRMLDCALDGVLNLKSIKQLVIDEIDEMLDLGFRKQIDSIFSLLPDRRQNLLFSATLSEEVTELIEDYFNAPMRVEAAPQGTPVEKIKQTAYPAPNFNTKYNLLEYLLDTDSSMQKVLVFASTRRLAERLYKKADSMHPEMFGVIHGNKAQNQRVNAVKNFKSGECRVLIATDIIARGIDIEDVSHVVNFDLPVIPEHYIHRIGRTGRADKEGSSISFISDKETGLQKNIEALMKQKIGMLDFPETVDISDELIDIEEPEMPEIQVRKKSPMSEAKGPAFHEKKEKNKKRNMGSSAKRKAKTKMQKKRHKRKKRK